MSVQISEHVIYVDTAPVVSAIPDWRRAKMAFPDAPLSPVPNPYGDDMHPDDFFDLRNACDHCQDGIDYGEDMVVTRTEYGHIEVYCATCFCRKYASAHRFGDRFRSTGLVYVNVRSEGTCYRWEAQP